MNMNQGRWRRVKDLYNSALELGPEERASFLRQECAGDEALRVEAERLLAREPEAVRFIESPALEVAARALAADRLEESDAGFGGTPQDHSIDEGKTAGHGAPGRHPPWWLYVVLFSSTSYVLAVWFVLFAGPESTGFGTRDFPEGRVVTVIQPGFAADRAGLQLGDIILSINGRTWPAAAREFRLVAAGERLELIVERRGKPLAITLTVERKGKAYWTDPEGLGFLAGIPVAALCLFLGWSIALRNPQAATARLGALILALWPAGSDHFFTGTGPGFVTFLHRLPLLLAALPAFAIFLAIAAWSPAALIFFASFPRKSLIGRWIWFTASLPAAVFILPYAAVFIYNMLILPPLPVSLPLWLNTASHVATLGYCFLIPIVLALNYRRLEDVNERRRMRVMAVGVFVAVSSYLPEQILLLYSSPSAWRILYAYWLSPLFVLGVLLRAAGPVSISYAVLRHRVFDVRVMIRQGLRYAAARRIILALAPLFGSFLVIDLMLHSGQTMAQTFAERGWLYALLGAAALAVHAKRKVWLSGLDRRFFRERYDARRILKNLLGEVRRVSSLDQAAALAVSQIDTALHPQYAALLTCLTDEDRFRVLAASGRFSNPPAIRSDSKLMGMVRLLGKPVEVLQTEAGWLKRRLPREEAAWLNEVRIEWIFPVSLGRDRMEVVLALAPKLSEEPYTQEDQDLLEGITSALTLLADRIAAAKASGIKDSIVGGIEAPQIPGRYRIRRELGRGGMGIVYEAHDTELERDVAVKLMRRELMASEEAVARFRREAKAAAAFSHPNVVTVYDFGMTAGGGAYLIMELLKGLTLRRLLEENGRLAPARAAAILRGVCLAVEAAHKRGLLHRDLKPENILLVPFEDAEVPKVLDFGIARPLQDGCETAPRQLLGTLGYMSPEQLRGGPPEPAWDLWALAVIGYEMLTGSHPFSGGDMPVTAAILAGRLTPARAFLGQEGEGWEEFFAHALAAENRSRPATARDLITPFDHLSSRLR